MNDWYFIIFMLAAAMVLIVSFQTSQTPREIIVIIKQEP